MYICIYIVPRSKYLHIILELKGVKILNFTLLFPICIHLLKVLGFTVCALILCMYSTRVMHSIEGASLRSQRIDSIGEGPSAV